jgi:hypothetical protein
MSKLRRLILAIWPDRVIQSHSSAIYAPDRLWDIVL